MPLAPYSRATALVLPLGQLQDRCLEVRCLGCPKVTMLPVRKLAMKLGPQVQLGDVLGRLKCTHCHGAARSVVLKEDLGGGPPDRVKPWSVRVLGE